MMEYPKASIAEYGFKEYRFFKMVFKYFNKIVVALIIIMMYLSIFVIAIQSFNSSTDIAVFSSFTLKWYGSIFKHRMLTNAIKNTFLVSLIATIVSTVLGTLVTIGINALPFKRRQKILLLNNIPILNADIVTGISLMLVFSLFINIFPYIFGLTTLILAHVFFTIPYVILSILPKLKEIDPNLMDAALDLGIKPYKALVKVIVPSIKAGIFAGMLLAFTMSIDDFVVSYYTTGNGFDNLSIWIYSSIGRKSLTPSVYAFSTLLTTFTMLILVGINLKQSKDVKKK